MSEVCDWSLTQTADAIAARKVSSVEVVEAALKRIAARQPILNCFVRTDA
jgi:Asp-tRNA(Asn)/Glu-tRNA(Gln) amidotransferase A subunit family amidase